MFLNALAKRRQFLKGAKYNRIMQTVTQLTFFIIIK